MTTTETTTAPALAAKLLGILARAGRSMTLSELADTAEPRPPLNANGILDYRRRVTKDWFLRWEAADIAGAGLIEAGLAEVVDTPDNEDHQWEVAITEAGRAAMTSQADAIEVYDDASEQRRATEAVLAAHQAGLDIAEWVAVVLARAAATLGSTEALLANRPGSWEAAHLRALLAGAVGDDDEGLAHYRQAAQRGSLDP